MRIVTKAIIVLGLLVAFGTCVRANEIVWTLNDVEFDNSHYGAYDPNSLTGTFTTNTVGSTWSVVSFSLTVTAIPTAGDTPYTNVFTIAQVVQSYLPTEIGLPDSSWNNYIDLYLSSPLTTSGGTISISSGDDCNGCGVLMTSLNPSVIGAAVPEPSSVPLLASGLFGLGLLFAKRRVIFN